MSLTLNGESFESKRLHQHCSAKLAQSSTPKWEKSIYTFILDWLSPEDSIILQTSGSTGKPKILHASKAAMIASAHLTQETFDLQENDSALLCLPAEYIAGKMMIVRAFVCGLNLCTVEPTSAPLDQTIDDFFKLVSMVPLQLAHYQKEYTLDQSLRLFKKIDTLLIGGAPIPKSIEAFIAKLPCNSFHTYGMTETLTHIAIRNIRQNPATYHTLLGITVDTNSDNCLIIKAPPLGIAELETTDIAQVLSEKEFKLLGRADNTINTGGIKVQPEAIEQKIEAEFTQYPILIFPSENERLGQQVNLAIETSYDKRLEQHIHALLQNLKTLNKYESPKRLFFMKRFIYTESGKLQRTQTIKALTQHP